MPMSPATKLIAAMVSCAMIAPPAFAEKANRLTDLVGMNAAAGESQLQSRGFSYAEGKVEGSSKISYYWHAGDKNCVRVETNNGRYTSITDASDKDCGHGGGNNAAVAAAAVGAVALGALLLSRKNKNKDRDRNDNDSGYVQDWQQVEAYDLQTGTLRIFTSPDKNSRVRGQVNEGALLRNYGCDDYNGESWCEVTTMNGRTRGWARDRYLRISNASASHLPSYGSGYGEMVEVHGLSSGTLKINSGPSKNDYVVGRVNQGSVLRKTGCQQSEGESWCHVTTLDGRMNGWSRERYLRTTSHGGNYPSYGNGQYGSISGIQGMRAVEAIDELRARGFENVDSFSARNTLYGIYYHRPKRLCVQTVSANGRIVDIRDIHSNPKCR